MTQFLEPLDIQTLHKTLPKKLSHIKEDAKVKFIKEAMSLYRSTGDLGKIDFKNSVYDGYTVKIVYTPMEPKIKLKHLINDIMEKWFFSNLEKNENVYFYRFINLFRAELTEAEWKDVELHLLNNENLVLRENFNQYCDYRRKLDEIDVILARESFNVKETY